MTLLLIALSFVTPNLNAKVSESTVEYSFKTNSNSLKASNQWDVVSKGAIAEIEISRK